MASRFTRVSDAALHVTRSSYCAPRDARDPIRDGRKCAAELLPAEPATQIHRFNPKLTHTSVELGFGHSTRVA